MTVENVTVNRSYPLPNAANPLNVDVARFITALTMLDIDVQSVLASVAGYAALDGPAFTGVPTAPTAASGTDTTQIATTAFVQAALDLLAASVAGGMSFKGNWDASSGSFPGGGAAQTGWYYIVSVAGTVDGVDFDVNDAIIAKADDAAVGTYTGNWVKRDATDAVQSVAGLTGAISAAALKTALALAIADVTGLQAALDGKSNTAHVHTGVYEPVLTPASQAEMEAGTLTALRSMTPQRVAQAIAALGGGGGWELVTTLEPTSDVAEVRATGLSGYGLIMFMGVVQHATTSTYAGLVVEAAASGGADRLLASGNTNQIYGQATIWGIIDNFNVADNKTKILHGLVSSGAGTLDRSDAVGNNNTSTWYPLSGYSSFAEVLDELAFSLTSGSLEGSTADKRTVIRVYGMA